MTPLKRATILARSKEILYETLIDYIENGKISNLLSHPDDNERMTSK